METILRNLLLLTLALTVCITPGLCGRPARILENPADSVVPKNEPVTMNCKAEGDPQPEITWFRDGEIIRASDNRGLRSILPSGSLFFLRVRKEDQGLYQCKAQNIYGESSSRNATLDVASIRDEFRQSPENTWSVEGEGALLTCDPPMGKPKPKITWKKDSQPIDLSRPNGRFKIVGPGSLSISQVRSTDEGRYSCIAKNIAGMKQSTALLRVLFRPKFTIVPSNISALIGSVLSFVCIAEGDPPPEITWKKGGDASLPHKRVTFDEESLRISNVTEEDHGEFICQAENKAGSISASAFVNILSPPTITVTPQPVEIQPNTTAYFGCESDGDPKPMLFWTREGSHSVIFQGTSLDERTHVTPEGTLQIDRVDVRDSGFYICYAVSQSGSAMHRVQLKVTPIEDLLPPIILEGGPISQHRALGSSAILPCVSQQGDLDDVVTTWYKNKKSFQLNHRIFTDDAGTLRINDLVKEDEGHYECVSSSRSGKYVWRSYLGVDSNIDYENNPLISDLIMNLRPPAPMKPRILRVESTTVTIAWNPKYFDHQPEDDDEIDWTIRGGSSSKLKRESDERSFPNGPGEDINIMLADSPYTDDLIDDDQEKSQKMDTFDSDFEPFSYKNQNTDEFDDSDEFDDDYKEKFEEKFNEEIDEDEENSNNLIITTTTTPSTTTATITTAKIIQQPALEYSIVNRNDPIEETKVSKNDNNQGLTYRVEYYSPEEDKSEWVYGAINLQNEICVLEYLKESSEYAVFIRAINSQGHISNPSPLAHFTTTTTIGGTVRGSEITEARKFLQNSVIVIFKNAYPISSSSIRIEWSIVSGGKYVEGFYIYFRPLGKMTHQMLTVLNAGSSANSFQIVGLSPFVTYEIFLLPFFKNVNGRPSNSMNVTTLEDVPTESPTLLETINVNGTALIVRWKPPPKESQNGLIIGFQLRVWSGDNLVGNMTVNGSTSSLLLNNLIPGQSYSLQIGSFTQKGLGAFSSKKSINFRPQIEEIKKIEINTNTIPILQNNNQNHNSKSSRDGNKMNNEVSLFEDDNEDLNDIVEENNNSGGVLYDGSRASRTNEAWFIGLIGSVIFVMLLVFVFALYLRRCQIRKDGDKIKVSTDIPDGSMPPHYSSTLEDESLWIDAHSKQLKALHINHNHNNHNNHNNTLMNSNDKDPIDMNEYENANNFYAVVGVAGAGDTSRERERERYSPVPYASTTLINGNDRHHPHKLSFSVFGDPIINGITNGFHGGGSSRPSTQKNTLQNNFGLMSVPLQSQQQQPPTNNTSSNNKTGSLNLSYQDMKKQDQLSKQLGSLGVLSTFQTPLPGRRHHHQMMVSTAKGGSVNNVILAGHYHEPNFKNYSRSTTHNGYTNAF